MAALPQLLNPNRSATAQDAIITIHTDEKDDFKVAAVSRQALELAAPIQREAAPYYKVSMKYEHLVAWALGSVDQIFEAPPQKLLTLVKAGGLELLFKILSDYFSKIEDAGLKEQALTAHFWKAVKDNNPTIAYLLFRFAKADQLKLEIT